MNVAKKVLLTSLVTIPVENVHAKSGSLETNVLNVQPNTLVSPAVKLVNATPQDQKTIFVILKLDSVSVMLKPLLE